MNDKKNVKLFVFLLVIFLAGAVALGFIPSEDSQGSLHRVNPARSGMMQTDPSDIMNIRMPYGNRAFQSEDNLSVIPHINAGVAPTNNSIPSFPVR